MKPNEEKVTKILNQFLDQLGNPLPEKLEESISARVLVPRDLNPEAFAVREDSTLPLQPTEMDARIAVPRGASPPAMARSRCSWPRR